MRLHTLGMGFPCDNDTLRAAVAGNRHLAAEVESVVARLRIDVVSYVDALWGLGLMLPAGRARRVLMVHVVGHAEDMRTALGHRPDAVIAPSRTVLMEAARAGYDTDMWRVVSNALLMADPGFQTPLRATDCVWTDPSASSPASVRRRASSTCSKPHHGRPGAPEVAIATAGFEADPGSQLELMRRCEACASARGWLQVRPGLRWCDVPGFLAGAAVVVVLSHRETFGRVALEAMSADTPVVARAVGNLPDLVGPAGALVLAGAGHEALWEAVRELTAGAGRYERASHAGIERSRGYRPVDVARRWIEAATR